jgi:hypothetical protein
MPLETLCIGGLRDVTIDGQARTTLRSLYVCATYFAASFTFASMTLRRLDLAGTNLSSAAHASLATLELEALAIGLHVLPFEWDVSVFQTHRLRELYIGGADDATMQHFATAPLEVLSVMGTVTGASLRRYPRLAYIHIECCDDITVDTVRWCGSLPLVDYWIEVVSPFGDINRAMLGYPLEEDDPRARCPKCIAFCDAFGEIRASVARRVGKQPSNKIRHIDDGALVVDRPGQCD